MKIFIVQDDGTKNFFSLTQMGFEIRTVIDRPFPVGDPTTHFDRIIRTMRDFTKDDFIVLVGDPLNIGLVTALAMRKGGGTFLKWDRQEREYLPISIDAQDIFKESK